MKLSTKKAHPQGKARGIVRAYRITSVGASASGGGQLPKDTNNVSLGACAYDGVDHSTSSGVFITFGLDDEPGALDGLIAKLQDLRAKQRALAADNEAIFAGSAPRIGWESPPCEHYAGKSMNVVREIDGVKFEDAQCTVVAGKPGRKS